MKKYLVFLASLSILLAACGGGNDENANAEVVTIGDDVEDATELTFWTFAELHV